MQAEEKIILAIYRTLEEKLDRQEIRAMLERPAYSHLGDIAFPCFKLAKHLRKSPTVIAAALSESLGGQLPSQVEKVEAAGGYVNFFYDKNQMAHYVLGQILRLKGQYGQSTEGRNEVIIIDYSSPNIAKPFSMGHLRSTVIGHSLGLIAEKNGYEVVRINHIGDWGTQFGKLLAAYRLWGNEERVKADPIKELLKLYVTFHEKAEKNPDLNDEGREWFKKLENGDKEAGTLWKWFRDESLKAFNKVYDQMGISFDSSDGEAFYNDKMDQVVKLLSDKQLLETSGGAKVVPLHGMPPCLIKKQDGTTLYATRDLAAAVYRQKTYGFTKSLYVVGHEQSLHFNQLFSVLKETGFEWADGMAHISFGMILKDGKKMSTRKGKLVSLEEVLKEAVDLALKKIEARNPSLENKNAIAGEIGTGAVIFHDLKHYREHDIEFSLETMLRFEGETGPYVQYTHARAMSLLKKGGFKKKDSSLSLADEEAWPVITQLMDFPDAVSRAFHKYDPSQIAKYTIDLASAFNQYYGSVRILTDPAAINSRLTLVYAVAVVLKEGLRLLGIKAPETM